MEITYSMDASKLPLPQPSSLSELESQMQLLNVSRESQDCQTFSSCTKWFHQRNPLFLSFCRNLHQFKHTSQTQDNPNFNLKNALIFDTNRLQNIDELITQLVNTNLEKDIVQHELLQREQQLNEASNTIKLLKNILMLLDMENQVAVQEAETLGYKLTSLLEENKELANEALFMKNEAVKLARCVLNMRDEHFDKVCILQNRIYALQASRNLQQSEEEAVYEKVLPGCFGLDNKHKNKKRKKSETSKPEEKRRSKWLKRLDNINPFTKCSLIPSATPSCSTLNLLD